MRWFIRSCIVLFLLWAVYAASPYWALYSLASAVETRDLATIRERVNFHAVRISLARQIAAAYLAATGKGNEVGSTRGQLAVGAGASFIETAIADYVTPEAFADLLANRGSSPAASQAAGITGGLSTSSMASFDRAWQLFLAAETRGFRAFHFVVPPEKPADQRFRLQFRLTDFTWRLVGLELPAPVAQRIVQDLIKKNAAAQ